jgi:hypothetical protein
MAKSFFSKIQSNLMLRVIIIILAAVSMIGVLNFTSLGGAKTVNAASAPIPIDMIYYGSNSSSVVQSIISAHPEFLVDNSPAGPWKGDANIKTFTAAGIQYFEYLDGGYEGTSSDAIPDSLSANLNYVSAVAAAGGTGIFIDQVSENPGSASISYLSQIYTKAHSLGLKVAFNTGVDGFSASLMSYCDYINGTETYGGGSLSSVEKQYASRLWLLTYNVSSASSAASLTNAAWSHGALAEYACASYSALPSWLASYMSLIGSSSPAPASTPTSTPTPTPTTTPKPTATPTPTPTTVSPLTSANTVGTVANTPVGSGAANEYCFNLKVTSSTVSGVTAGQQVWCAASTTDFPNLLTVGATLTGNLDHSLGWWVLKQAGTSTVTPTPTPTTTPKPTATPTPTPTPTTVSPLTSANTIGTVASTPVSSGAANEYCFNLKVTSSTVSGVTAGQQVWCAASTTNYPNLLTPGATLTGNLNHSLGWWVISP